MKLNKQVQAQIERLTNNEDFRQDLWVAHLSGQQQLPTILKTIKKQHYKNEEFQHLLSNFTMSDGLIQLLDNFHDIDRSILHMLIIGYTINEISDHCGTSTVRVQQAINVIRKHSVWSKLLVSV